MLKQNFINTKLHLTFIHSEIITNSLLMYLQHGAKTSYKHRHSHISFLHSALSVGLDKTDVETCGPTLVPGAKPGETKK